MEEVVEFADCGRDCGQDCGHECGHDCGHDCAHHAAWMSPAIWSDLPEELLQRVFARLPLTGIIRLHCLSKQWNNILNSDSFKQVCTEAHPKLFAIIPPNTPENYFAGFFEVFMYDLRSNTRHTVEIFSGYGAPFHTMNASDGGLVCFACTSVEEDFIQVPVVVCNPLTRTVRALPLHSHNKRPPKMLQLVMDRITKCYQVLIVNANRHGVLVAEVFHSNTGAWTTTNLSDLKYVSGYRFSWSEGPSNYNEDEVAPCVYDCAKGHFIKVPVAMSKHGALVKDRLFVLCQEEGEVIEGGGTLERGYYIAEYQGLECGAKWLKLKDHSCSNWRYPGSSTKYYNLMLYACKGFLLVVAENMASPYEHCFEMLYDLSTGKWHALSPGIPAIEFEDSMCELQWDAIP